MATSRMAALVIAATLTTGCASTQKSSWQQLPPETLALGIGGFVLVSAGGILYMKSNRPCIDDFDCTEDETHSTYRTLGLVFFATGVAALATAVLLHGVRQR